jgi:uroporphyrinogen-III synthase
MPSLAGKTIAITEARRSRELTMLITKLGGVALAAPAMREVPRTDLGPAVDALDRICRGDVAAVIFMTGVGARAFLALAADGGRREALLTALERILVVVRGPKPLAALKEAGVRVDVVPSEPTTDGVLAALATRPLAGALVAVQLYGDDNPALVEGLAARGARVLEIPLYEWALPDDIEPLARVIRAVIGGDVDVIAFTSSPQVRHLLVVAESIGLREALLRSLRERVVVASIGPVCAATLSAHGVASAIQADKGTMGALVHAIAEHAGR